MHQNMRHTNNTQPTPPSTQTKPQGVCNTTVYIEGMENELEHFPQLIDDNGFDTYPKFVTWCVRFSSRRLYIFYNFCDE